MRARLLRLAAIVVALVAVNTALSFHNVWPTPWITVRPELSAEAAAIVLLLTVAAAWNGVSARLVNGLAVAMLLLALARYMEVTAPALYGRAINLYWDTRHLPAVAAMVAENFAPWLLIISVAGGLALLVLVYLILRRALTTIVRADRERRVLGVAAAGLVGAYLVGYYGSVGPLLRWFSIPVTQTYTRQIGFVAEALAGTGAAASLPAEDPFSGWTWPNRPTADLFVVFVESYGAVSYDAAEIANALAPNRARFATGASAAGAATASALVTSPTFGGVSWLAHSSFMTGIDVTDSGAYNVLMTQQRETLVDRFRAAGYRTVALMPGLRQDWPEGSFYGFDRIYGERDIDYSGPAFGWWRVPDQFALARLAELELSRADRAPLMTFFPTINTHMPFSPTPPYQPDWNALTGSEPFPPALLEPALGSTTELTDLRPAYTGALAYTFDYLTGLMQGRLAREFMLIIIGDHQPPASVSGQGARWEVPVHVVASDDSMLEPFMEIGFVPGIEPAMRPVARTHELSALVLEALGGAHTAH